MKIKMKKGDTGKVVENTINRKFRDTSTMGKN